MAMTTTSSGSGSARRGQRGGGRRAPLAEINVTPFVDVMLVLLIIFMVTAPLLNAAVPIDLPDSRAAPLEQDDRAVDIAIDRQGRLFVDGEPVADRAIADRLGELAAGPSDEPPRITLRADEGISFRRVAFVMGELNRAGLNRISLVTRSSSAAP